MMPTQVWTEQRETGRSPGWYDCMQASYLLTLVAAGLAVSKFTAGIYTPAERERFEDAEGLPEWTPGAAPGTTEETGLFNYGRCDTAAIKLYGTAAHVPGPSALGDLIIRPDRCLALSGIGPGLPVVQTGFVGAHSIAVVPVDGVTVSLYDPLAKQGDAPRPWPTHEVLSWHQALPNRDYRWTQFDEFAPAKPPVSGPKVHTVVSGDVPLRLCRTYGISLGQLVQWNRGRYPSLVRDPGFIRIGWALQVSA
jgi:hypothetical protein